MKLIQLSLRILARPSAWLCLMTAFLIVGCGPTLPEMPETDEPMKRAIAEHVNNEDAAQFYTYRDVQNVPDFFKGMDAISQATEEDAVPDALLDTVDGERPKTEVVDVDLSNSVSGNHSEIIGRNTWMVWCAGNEGFWDWLATDSLGFIDLLKLVDSRNRNQRFMDTGMINEPGMTQSPNPSSNEFGLWLDRPIDPKYRKWREYYLNETFTQLASGTHYSQIGLQKRTRGGEYAGAALFHGEPRQNPATQRYRYPSEYLPDNLRETVYAAAMESDDDYANADYADSDQQTEADSIDGYSDSKSDSTSTYATRKYDNEYDRTIPPPDLYGLSSGVVGLRLFPNPYFDAEAQRKWNAVAYEKDESYWSDPNLIRPFRVGMSCAFCHTSFHPLRPPQDTNNPRWENLSGSIGAQYLSMRATVGNLLQPDNFVYHLLESQPRGTIDTSLIASDNINNPNTMNAVFGLPERAILSLSNPRERISESSRGLPSLWDDLDESGGPLGDDVIDPVPEYWVQEAQRLGLLDRVAESNGTPRFVPRILLDGSDGIGTWGALARVYLNIGSYWEQWNELHQVVVGFTEQRPFLLRDCETNSVYWNATEKRVPGLRDYFLRITPPMPLLSTPGGVTRLAEIDAEELQRKAELENLSYPDLMRQQRGRRIDVNQLAMGRRVFAENCIVCHSSIQPESTIAAMLEESSSSFDNVQDFVDLVNARQAYRSRDEQTGEFWEHDPGGWLGDTKYQQWARNVVEQPEFWKQNFLSTDYRIPINLVKTNAGRAMGTNAMQGHMWQDFASDSYRELPSPGEIEYFDLYKGENGAMSTFSPRHRTPEGAPPGGGGPGYYRVPSLISIWATAPFLHNNSLGLFNNDPSVDGRLEAFDDAIRKLLWPEKRLQHSSYNQATPSDFTPIMGWYGERRRRPIDNRVQRVPTVAGNLLGLGGMWKWKSLGWLHGVWPNWLASAILLIGALLMLLCSNSKLRRGLATGIFSAAVLLVLIQSISYFVPTTGLTNAIRMSELWIPVATIGFIGVILSLPLWDSKPVQRAGYILLVVAIALGTFGVLLRFVPSYSFGDIIASLSPWWLPGLTLLIVSIVLWLPVRPRVVRFLSYALIVGAIFSGAVIYYQTGKLGDVTIGPIPKGTPVNLLANFNSEADRKDQIKAIASLTAGLAEIKSRNLDDPVNADELDRVLKEEVAPALMKVNKCPDFVMDQGHYYPWFDDMTDEEKKRADRTAKNSVTGSFPSSLKVMQSDD